MPEPAGGARSRNLRRSRVGAKIRRRGISEWLAVAIAVRYVVGDSLFLAFGVRLQENRKAILSESGCRRGGEGECALAGKDAAAMTVKTKVVRAGLHPVLSAALIAVLATIIDPANAIAATGRISVESGGLARTALLIQHRRLKQGRRPLVVVLRGGRERALRPRRLFGLEELARSSGPILLYPDPLGGRWSDSAGVEMTRDSTFIRDLIGKLVSDGLVDRRKVFMIGISNGGVMALRLACEHANLFAGVAAVLASMPADVGAACKPSRPFPFILIAGTADPLVSFNGGKAGLPDNKAELLPIEATLGVFGKAAGCGEGRTTTAFPDRNPNDGSRAYLDRLNGCKAPVALVRIEGGGHAVPARGSPGDPESTRPTRNNDIESAKVIWDFFRQAEN